MHKPNSTPLQHRPRLAQPGSLAQWQDFLRDESAQDMIEYALAAALIGLVALSAVRSLGTHISSAYSSIGTNLTSDT